MSEPTKSKFFTYEDGEGHVYVVDSIEQIPKKYRELAEEVRLGERLRDARKHSLREAKKVQREVGDVLPFVNDLDLPSLAVGFALSLVVFLVFAMIRRTLGMMVKVALIGVIVCLLGGAYLGWLRRASGLGEGGLASPKEVIDDARRAASDFQKRIDAQEKTLKKIEEGAR
jgi:hypothetical protein